MKINKLTSKIRITGIIELVSGMRIGGTFTPMSIGLPNLTVIRNPLDQLPYIPGSSLKGKMRSLMEQHHGIAGNSQGSVIKFGPSDDESHSISKLFGYVKMVDGAEDEGKSKVSKTMASRLIVRDGMMLNPEQFANTDLLYTESKIEVVIDRVTSMANPRTMERVPRGAQFPLDMIVNLYDGEDTKVYLNLLKEGMRLLEDDFLGGSGSRGYGQIAFKNLHLEERTDEYYLKGSPPASAISFNLGEDKHTSN